MIGKRSSIWIAMNIRGMSGKWKLIWHSSPSPKYVAASSGHWFASESSSVPGARSSMWPRNCLSTACVSGRFSQLVPSRSKR